MRRGFLLAATVYTFSLCLLGMFLSQAPERDDQWGEVALPELEEPLDCRPYRVHLRAMDDEFWGVPLLVWARLENERGEWLGRVGGAIGCDRELHGVEEPTWSIHGNENALLVVDSHFPPIAEVIGPPGPYTLVATYRLHDGKVLTGYVEVEVTQWTERHEKRAALIQEEEER
jgi:hypothetical protein